MIYAYHRAVTASLGTNTNRTSLYFWLLLFCGCNLPLWYYSGVPCLSVRLMLYSRHLYFCLLSSAYLPIQVYFPCLFLSVLCERGLIHFQYHMLALSFFYFLWQLLILSVSPLMIKEQKSHLNLSFLFFLFLTYSSSVEVH